MRVLEIKGLTKHFAGLAAVESVDCHLDAGEILGLIGPNGAGKTTIFNMVSGVYSPTKGMILFKDRDITGMAPPRICQLGIARTFQIVKPLSHLTVLENVMMGAFLRIKEAKKSRVAALEVLEFTGQLAKKDVLASSLTLGERKKLEISRALATQPLIMLLDECMAGLNSREISDAIELIQKIRNRGVTLIVIEHVMKAIMAISDRIMVLNYGKKIMEGTPSEVASDPSVIKAYLGETYAQS